MLDDAGKEDASVPWLTQEIVSRSTRQLDMETFDDEERDTVLEILRLLPRALSAHLKGQIDSNPHPFAVTSAENTTVEKAQEAGLAPLWLLRYYLGTQHNQRTKLSSSLSS